MLALVSFESISFQVRSVLVLVAKIDCHRQFGNVAPAAPWGLGAVCKPIAISESCEYTLLRLLFRTHHFAWKSPLLKPLGDSGAGEEACILL